jgi:two-component system chemotaxis response regulator CheV
MTSAFHAHGAAHQDRLELLLFRLKGEQRFGINVLKVKEVIPGPRLTKVPHAHPAVCGVAHLRGEPLSVIDLGLAIGRAPASGQDGASIIITEFNRSMQGFLVGGVDRIVVCDWKNVLPPPIGSGTGSYITGVTRIEEHLVQILDVERVLGEVVALEVGGEHLLERRPELADRIVLVVDDSMMARNQTAHTLDAIGVQHVMARDGREALSLLRERLDKQGDAGRVDMIISDIEMPEMDGYTLAREVRRDSGLSQTYLLLHTSLNGAVNAELATKAGANDVLTKFVPEELARAVLKGLGALHS